MNPLTKRALNLHSAINDAEKKSNYIIAIAAGIILGIMLGMAV